MILMSFVLLYNVTKFTSKLLTVENYPLNTFFPLYSQFKIRKEALTGLAMIYKNHLNDEDCPQATKKAVTWIKDKILHG